MHDLLGMTDRHVAKFVKQYANLRQQAADGIREYVHEVQNNQFPSKDHVY
jgi:3-methyl-2-oxobutanoate hydroxymethyltransferase